MSNDAYAMVVILEPPVSEGTRDSDGYYPIPNWRWWIKRKGEASAWEQIKKKDLENLGPGDTISFYISPNPELAPYKDPDNYTWVALGFAPDRYQKHVTPLKKKAGVAWRRGFGNPPQEFHGGPGDRMDLSWPRAQGKKLVHKGLFSLTVRIHTDVDDPNRDGKKCRFILDPRMCVGEECEG
jgi:hypothetical protein